MGLRSRLKESLKSALGRGPAPTGATAPAGAMPTTAATPTARPAPAAAPPETPDAALQEKPAPAPPETPAAASPETPAAAPPEEPAAVQQDKIEKHRRKTKAGMLKWLAEQEGGAAHMGVMHDHCEKRFFVAHRAFSNLMEDLTGGDLVTYDAESGMVTITAAGRAWRG